MKDKVEVLQEILGEVREFYSELTSELMYGSSAGLEYYTEEDLENDLAICRRFIENLQRKVFLIETLDKEE